MSIYPLLTLHQHAWSDALVVLVAFLIPWIGEFAGYNAPSIVLWAAAAIALTTNLLSSYPLGVVKLLPMRLHSLLELGSAPLLIVVLPWIFRDVPVLPVLLPALGIVNLLTNVLTDYRQAT